MTIYTVVKFIEDFLKPAEEEEEEDDDDVVNADGLTSREV